MAARWRSPRTEKYEDVTPSQPLFSLTSVRYPLGRHLEEIRETVETVYIRVHFEIGLRSRHRVPSANACVAYASGSHLQFASLVSCSSTRLCPAALGRVVFVRSWGHGTPGQRRSPPRSAQRPLYAVTKLSILWSQSPKLLCVRAPTLPLSHLPPIRIVHHKQDLTNLWHDLWVEQIQGITQRVWSYGVRHVWSHTPQANMMCRQVLYSGRQRGTEFAHLGEEHHMGCGALLIGTVWWSDVPSC